MQKKIIALAIAAALTSPALAMAEANVYGLVDLSIDRVNDGATTAATTNQLVSNNSRVGVKGSEAMGDNTFVWQMEGTVGMDAGATGTATTGVTNQSTTKTSLFDRDTFIGVANANAGTVILGQHDTPYKMATRKLDVFADSAADNRKMMSGQDLRLSNVIAYISPAFSGLTVAAATVFGAEKAAVADKKGSALSLAGMYSQGPIYATLAYQTIKLGTAGSGDLGAGLFGPFAVVEDKASAFKLGGGYTVDQGSVSLVFEKATFTPVLAGSSSSSNTNIYLAGKFNVSATDAVKAAYTKHGATKTGSTNGTDNASRIAIGYDHDMSKTTQVYALYTKETTNSAVNVNPSVLSFGIKHSF